MTAGPSLSKTFATLSASNQSGSAGYYDVGETAAVLAKIPPPRSRGFVCKSSADGMPYVLAHRDSPRDAREITGDASFSREDVAMSTSFTHPSRSFPSLTDRILDDLIENRFGGLRESIAAETSTREAGPETEPGSSHHYE